MGEAGGVRATCVGAGGIGGIGPPHFQDWGDNPPPLFFRRVCNVLMVYYIKPSSSNCLSMHYETAPPAARAMQGLSNRRALCVRYREINV